MRTFAVVVLVVLVAGLAYFATQTERAPRSPARTPGETAAVLESAPSTLVQPASASATPSPVTPLSIAASAPPQPSSSAPERVARRIDGLVVDPLGRPVSGVSIGRESGAAGATSGSDGTFAIESSGDDVVLLAKDARWCTVYEGVWSAADPARTLVVVAPAGRIDGFVGIRTAVVSVRGVVDPARMPHSLERSRERVFAITAAPDGSFASDVAPLVEGAQLVVEAPSFTRATRDVDPRGTRGMRFVLHSLSLKHAPWVTGLVVHADGSPAREAGVLLGDNRTVCDDRGRFELPLGNRTRRQDTLVAYVPGFQTAVEPSFGARFDDGGQTSDVRLQLGGASLSIRGRVFDASGAPDPHAVISLENGVVVNEQRYPAMTAEELSGRWGYGASTNGISNGGVRTSSTGEFEIGGLFERPYRLRVRSKAMRYETEPIPVGSIDVDVRPPAYAFLAKLRGIVLARDRTPLPGIDVDVLIDRSDRPEIEREKIASRRTDARGAFELAFVPRRHGHLQIRGDRIRGVSRDLADVRDDEVLEFVVDRTVRFQIVAGAATPRATSVRALDANGEPLVLDGWIVFDHMQETAWKLDDGASPPLTTAESMATLVFYADERELERREVRVTPGELVLITR